LKIASQIGDNILAYRTGKGFFVFTKNHIYTRFDDLEHLALLYLFATIETKLALTPWIWPNEAVFGWDYRQQDNRNSVGNAQKQELNFQDLIKQLEQKRNQLASTPSIRPVEGWITSKFGNRLSPFTGQKDFHSEFLRTLTLLKISVLL